MLKQVLGQKIKPLFSKFLLSSGQYDGQKFLIRISRLPGAWQGEHHLRGKDRRLPDVHQPGGQMDPGSWRRHIPKYDNFLYLWLTNTGIHWSWNRIGQVERNERRDSCKFVLIFVLGNKIELCALFPDLAQDGDDVVEQPIPEQFKTTINGKKLITSATESV